jgi:hypothetical protein
MVRAGLWRFATLLTFGVVLTMVGCENEAEVSERVITDTSASPTALAALPLDIERADLTIDGGEFVEDELKLTRDAATMLITENRDETAYHLRIGELVPDAVIPPRSTTRVDFLPTIPGELQASLIGEESDEPIDTLVVIVQDPLHMAP